MHCNSIITAEICLQYTTSSNPEIISSQATLLVSLSFKPSFKQLIFKKDREYLPMKYSGIPHEVLLNEIETISLPGNHEYKSGKIQRKKMT